MSLAFGLAALAASGARAEDVSSGVDVVSQTWTCVSGFGGSPGPCRAPRQPPRIEAGHGELFCVNGFRGTPEACRIIE
ncbi:MAG: hypothetical protein KDK89_00375 [Alphaproteobacteria bacterium]|nr:hypothetical protein [Alphaproteobacteria bacterium]